MAIRLGDVAPDFSAETTEGPVNFYEYLGDSWGILFSHPKDFTPVCTTELGAFAARRGDFDKRNTKLIAVSVDPVESHKRWKATSARRAPRSTSRSLATRTARLPTSTT